MGKQVDTFGAYVEARLRAWAREIRGGRENLYFSAVNHIAFKPAGKALQVSPLTWQTEDVVTEIGKESPDCAVCLRTVYFVGGTWSEDRRKILEYELGRKLTRYRFWQLYYDAFGRARSFFEVLSKIT